MGKFGSNIAENPIFRAGEQGGWEQHKVTACQVIRDEEWYLMFYIGFYDKHRAFIGLARSRDGLNDWQRHPANPIIRPGLSPTSWDYDAIYKPFAIRGGGAGCFGIMVEVKGLNRLAWRFTRAVTWDFDTPVSKSIG